VCLRDDAGVLHVCESTTPEVVCTPYQQWITHAAAEPRTIILAPLRPDLRANFNRTAAWAFLNSTVGYSYGYFNFLLGWVDTANDNYPCMPPTFDRCLVWEHMELVALMVDKFSPTLAGRFFNQALNHRVNATGLPVADVLMRGFLFGWIDTANDNYPCLPGDYTRCIVWEHAEYLLQFLERLSPAIVTKFAGQALNHRVNATGLPVADVLMRGATVFGYTGGDVTAVPEQDAWVYNTTRYGKPAVGLSNVCSTYVCNVLRHAGAFAGTALAAGVQCTEQTPWNMEALQLWDASRMGAGRPAVCQQRDPGNANCVLCGHTTFHLGPDSNSKPLAAWTGERCGGRGPWYQRNVTSC